MKEAMDATRDTHSQLLGVSLADSELDTDIFGYPTAAEVLPAEAAPPGAALDMHATSTILQLRQSIEDKDATIASLKAQVEEATDQIERWHSAVAEAHIIPHNVPIRPEAVGPAAQRMHARQTCLQELVIAGQRRETSLLIKLTAIQEDLASTRSHLFDCAGMVTPVNIQTQKLLLDPVVNAQYARLKSATDALEKKVKELQDDLAAVQFTPHSKNGKMLMAKCRTLQEENEEIGREAAEGKLHDLENKLALQKQLNAELKRGYQELQDYVGDMSAETERLQETVYKLQRQLQLREQELHELTASKNREPPIPEGRPPQYQERGWDSRDGPGERERGRDPRRREGKRVRPERGRGRDDDYDYR